MTLFNLERLGDMFLGATAQTSHGSADLIGSLKAAGIDPAILDGLDTVEITQLLTNIGLDPSQFDIAGIASNVLGAQDGILGELRSLMGQRDH
jgi:hypothetical protein